MIFEVDRFRSGRERSRLGIRDRAGSVQPGMENLKGMKVAILVENGFEEVEMTEPRKALDQAGAQTTLVSPAGDQVRSWNHTDWGDRYRVDRKLSEAREDEFDALLQPGGVISPDK